MGKSKISCLENFKNFHLGKSKKKIRICKIRKNFESAN